MGQFLKKVKREANHALKLSCIALYTVEPVEEFSLLKTSIIVCVTLVSRFNITGR